MSAVVRCAENVTLSNLKWLAHLKHNPYVRPSLEFQLKKLKTKRVFIGQMHVRTRVFKRLLEPANRTKLLSHGNDKDGTFFSKLCLELATMKKYDVTKRSRCEKMQIIKLKIFLV